jgi:NDP-sugar pyrophosphorylase family protein
MTNIVVPMAGVGSRFFEKGYDKPKFLLDVLGSLMIEKAVWSCGISGRHIYIVQAEHNRKYNLSELLPTITPTLDVVVLEVDGPTGGAVSTTLIAKEYINNNDSLVICNSDQIVEWDSNSFLVDADQGRALDGCIPVFTSNDSKWSYAKTDNDGTVTEVAEKNPISDQASVGIYYWRAGSDYVKYAEQMIEKNIRVNNEFYICPVYNEAIKDGKKIGIYAVDKMIGLGTPEDLENYVKSQTNIS